MKPIQQNQFRKALLNWYRAQKRNLPWRGAKDPYKILVSEVMLQQTQVQTVIPYYKKWMKEFGSIKKLAGASLDKVLLLWEGMGYYTRARNLHQAAREIEKKYGGEVPRSYEMLLTLPGVGTYTAGAVASIAYNKRVPCVDANTRRVLSRVYCLRPSSLAEKKLQKIALDLMGKASPADFNQALMEVGSLICVAGNPRCDICPINKLCQAASRGAQNQYPSNQKRKKIEEIKVALGIIIRNGNLFVQKRPSHGLFAGLWEFPGGKIESGETPDKALIRELKEELGAKVKILSKGKTIQHSYTRFRVKLHPFLCGINGKISLKEKQSECRWISIEDMNSFAFPAANRKVFQNLMKDKSFYELLKKRKATPR